MEQFRDAALLYAETAKNVIQAQVITGGTLDIDVVLDIINKANEALFLATEIIEHE